MNLTTDQIVELIVILWAINGFCRIPLGLTHYKHNTNYDYGDVIIGIVTLIVSLWILGVSITI